MQKCILILFISFILFHGCTNGTSDNQQQGDASSTHEQTPERLADRVPLGCPKCLPDGATDASKYECINGEWVLIATNETKSCGSAP